MEVTRGHKEHQDTDSRQGVKCWRHKELQKQEFVSTLLELTTVEWAALNQSQTQIQNYNGDEGYEGAIHINRRIITKTSEPTWETVESFWRKLHFRSRDLRKMKSKEGMKQTSQPKDQTVQRSHKWGRLGPWQVRAPERQTA